VGSATLSIPIWHEFKSTKDHGKADALSRLNVERATQHHPLLSKVLRYTRRGWPDQIPNTLKPFSQRKSLKATVYCGEQEWSSQHLYKAQFWGNAWRLLREATSGGLVWMASWRS
jgi:hypothetical protein